MQFITISRNTQKPNTGINTVYLEIDHWNDFSFVTMFHVTAFDESGLRHEIGSVKIGFKGQTVALDTYSSLNSPFSNLGEGYFSLGTDVDYYRKLKNDLSDEFRNTFLSALKDVVHDQANLEGASNEEVFGTSLLRGVSLQAIKGQFKRVLDGGAPLTNFSFSYSRPQEERHAGVELEFEVKADSKPSTNIHAIIGRNGVGKTTILNGMINAVTKKNEAKGSFLDREGVLGPTLIEENYFSSLVSVSFSAFDPFMPPPDQPNPALGTCYYYIGLKDSNTPQEEGTTRLKALEEIHKEFIGSLFQCFSENERKKRWLRAIKTLESDENFAEMGLGRLTDFNGEELSQTANSLIERMSSGHAVVLLTVTKLVATVEEKTLVIVDEPESHLHPPLLSAFTRALSQLLHDRNGVAIIATHSPVVLQEIPKFCVWKITRSRLAISTSRPEIETFGENVGVLTREVFGLEVVKSGFHTLLQKEVSKGSSYDEIMDIYGGQLGYEAKAILQSMILERDHGEDDS